MPTCAICSTPLDVTPIRDRVVCSQPCRSKLQRRREAARRAADRRELVTVLQAATADVDRLAGRLLAR